jgi:hypothetical protein
MKIDSTEYLKAQIERLEEENNKLKEVFSFWIKEEEKWVTRNENIWKELGGYKVAIENIQKEIGADTDILKKLWNIMLITNTATKD